MLYWREIPFLPLSIACVVGIAAGEIYTGSKLPEGVALVFLILSFTVSVCAGLHRSAYRFRSVFLIWCCLSFALLGQWRYIAGQMDLQRQEAQLDSLSSSAHALRILVEECRERPRGLQIQGRLLAVHGGETMPFLPQVMAYVEKDSASSIRGGDVLWIVGKLRPVRDNPNPEAFNYAGFLRRRGITHEVYSRKGYWRHTSQTSREGQSFLFFSRQYCLDRLREALPDSVHYSIAAALVIGNRESLQVEVRDVFSKTGAMHVLAVSGLHVGMVAWCLTWVLLKIPGKGQSWTMVRVLAQFAGVWAYVLICGAGPSVVRAGLMFSWYLAGKTLGRPSNIWNAWFGSAFLLLLYEPQWLFDIGFQLSYLAVGGIVLLEPLISRGMNPSQRVVEYFWKLTSVGLAAQLATGPLSVYYFHQFPLGFLLSGWVAVPLGAVIQALGMAVGLFGGIPFIPEGLGTLLGLSIAAMYGALEWIARLPGQCVEGLWLSLAGLCWGYALLASAVRLSLAFSKRWAWICLVLLLAGAAGRTVQAHRANRRAEVICYGIQGASALEFWQGRKVAAWYEGPEGKILDQCTNLHIQYGNLSFAPPVRPQSLHGLAFTGTLIAFRGLRFFIWDGRARTLPPPGTDYWILRGNPYLPPKGLEARLPKKGVVIDGSNAPSRASFYLRWCKSQDIRAHYTLEQGAWRLQAPALFSEAH